MAQESRPGPSAGEPAGTFTNPEDEALDAAKRGDQHFLRMYLDQLGGDVNLRDHDTQGTLLHWACSYGRLGAVSLLLDRGADVRATDNESWTGLHWACHSSATDTARLLLERGAPSDERDTQDWTPLHVACHAGRTDTVRFLIGAGAIVWARTGKKLTALHIACESGFTDTARLLLESGLLCVSALDDEAYCALHLASAGGHTDVVRLLLEAGASPDSTTERNHRPLHLAAQYGHSSVVKLLLEAGAAVDARDDGNYTPTHLACTYGHTETTRLLLEHGADVEALDSEEWSPFHWACQLGNVYTARLLVAKGANRAARTSRGHQALHLAAENGHQETVKMLLDSGADPNAKDEVLYTPLHWAAQYGYLEVAALLLSMGAGPSHQADYRDTPLHLACLLGHGTVVRLLLDNGADPCALDEDGKLPEEVVGLAEGSDLVAAERTEIARQVRAKRRSITAASDAAAGRTDGSRDRAPLHTLSSLGSVATGFSSEDDDDDEEEEEEDDADLEEGEIADYGASDDTVTNVIAEYIPLVTRAAASVNQARTFGASPTDVASRARAYPRLGSGGGRGDVSRGGGRGGCRGRQQRLLREDQASASRRPGSTDGAAAEVAKLRIELDGARKCVACLSRDRDTLLFPCKHLVLCGPCFARVVRQADDDAGVDAAAGGEARMGGRCPTCRAEICGHLSGVIMN